MAIKEILIDDIDGETEGAETLTFFVEGQEYEIDLAEENRELFQAEINKHLAFLKEMADYGRPVRRQTTVKVPRGRTPEELAHIRTWLRSQGHEVSDKGRVPEKLLDLWETRTRVPSTQKDDQVTEEKPETASVGE